MLYLVQHTPSIPTTVQHESVPGGTSNIACNALSSTTHTVHSPTVQHESVPDGTPAPEQVGGGDPEVV